MISDDYQLGRAIDAAGGSHMAAILLFRFAFMDTLPKVKFKGEEWIVNSNEDYERHFRMTTWQLRDAMDTLIGVELIRKEVHLFKNRTRPFIQLTPKAREALGKNHKTAFDESHKTGNVETHKSYKKGVLEESSVMEMSEHSLAGLTPEPGVVSEEGVSGEEESMKNVKSVLDVEAAVKAHKHLHKPDTVGSLVSIWRDRVKEITGSYVHVMKKEKDKLPGFLKKCPPGRAEAILNVVLDDWIMFVKRCETMAGATHTPSVPAIWFLLQYAHVAVILAEPKKSPPKKHEATGGVSLGSQVLLTSHEPAPKPDIVTSLAEIWGEVTDDEEE